MIIPKECLECVAYHQEGHISMPCKGDFAPEKCYELEPPEEETE